MAFWSKKETEMEQTYAQIAENPGLNPTELAEQLGGVVHHPTAFAQSGGGGLLADGG